VGVGEAAAVGVEWEVATGAVRISSKKGPLSPLPTKPRASRANIGVWAKAS
jgi:hypothetical protein